MPFSKNGETLRLPWAEASWKYGWLFVRSEFIFPPHLQTVSPTLPVLIIFSQSHFSSPSPYFSGLSFLDLVFYHSTPSWTFLPMEASKSCFQENKLPDTLYLSSESSLHFWKLAFPRGTLPPAVLIKNAALSPTLGRPQSYSVHPEKTFCSRSFIHPTSKTSALPPVSPVICRGPRENSHVLLFFSPRPCIEITASLSLQRLVPMLPPR